jgi:hypothetical protein
VSFEEEREFVVVEADESTACIALDSALNDAGRRSAVSLSGTRETASTEKPISKQKSTATFVSLCFALPNTRYCRV